MNIEIIEMIRHACSLLEDCVDRESSSHSTAMTNLRRAANLLEQRGEVSPESKLADQIVTMSMSLAMGIVQRASNSADHISMLAKTAAEESLLARVCDE